MRRASQCAALLAFALALGCATPPAGVFRLVRPTVAFELLRDSPDTQILDLRPLESYVGPSGHLAGALCFPLDQLDVRKKELRYLREETFLIYCDTDECVQQGLEWFLANGFENAMVMDGGIESWLASGFGTVQTALTRSSDSGVADEEP